VDWVDIVDRMDTLERMNADERRGRLRPPRYAIP